MKYSFSVVCIIALLSLISCSNKPKEVINEAGIPQMPMVMPYENTLEYTWSQKQVIESKLLSDAESIQSWEHRGYGSLTVSNEKAYKGKSSILISSPTKGESTPPGGRPWGISGAFFKVDNEDWRQWNRISFWIYPDLPGFKQVSINTIFYNNGEEKVPLVKNGVNFQMLENQKWNKVYWEIEHLGRDKVTGFVIQYRLQGSEPGTSDVARYYIDEVYFEKVDPDHYEGWNIQPGQIAYNHSGYVTGYTKVAMTPETNVKTFTLLDANTKEKVLEGTVEKRVSSIGEFSVIDFTGINKKGDYVLEAGKLQTKPFRIGDFSEVYRNSIIKTINHFYTQRCGYAIDGVHDACHLDWLSFHGDLSVGIHGGWHDAGDLSQGLGNTAEGAWAMIELAEKLQKTDPELSNRLLDEAKWGLDWLLKTRFGDGYRTTWSTKDMWTDNIMGTSDDFNSNASFAAGPNYTASITEAAAAKAFRTKNASFADYALACAIQDYNFAVSKEENNKSAELAGVALRAALALYEVTQNNIYKEDAIKNANYIVNCQQQTDLDANLPLKGFFYRNAEKDAILHYPHRGQEHNIAMGLAKACKLFPDKATEWKNAIQLYANYYKEIAAYNAPYYMLPAGVYDLAKARNEEETEQITKGIKLNERYYLKAFPVWGEFRGNSGTILTQSKGLAEIANILKDKELMDIVYHQLEWHLGKNPFAQSLMYGEGYRYAGQYSTMSGNLVGGLPVGVQTHFNADLPYWPAENCHNWKEIWVLPSAIWLMLMCDFI